MTLDEFLAWEREQPERHEFADGVIVMMTGGSIARQHHWKRLRGIAASAARDGLPGLR